jgi:hypothetical protein
VGVLPARRPINNHRLALEIISTFSDVSCEWVELNMKIMSIHMATPNDLKIITACAHHKNCNGHQVTNAEKNVFLIPYGFATPDELSYNELAALNTTVFSGNGTKSALNMADFSRSLRGIKRF